ncbi:MAG: hypothetical protein H0U12_00005 [Thermoleophilaceae bacterium]|nr:hypothetical protein [Thermoleophilaceae bacterium]
MTDAGISLSGGGLRAAAFSLGVLQVLQAQRGLLFGSRAVKWLAAVSGGSYIAGAHVLGGRQRAVHPTRYAGGDPLAQGTPEERYVLQHARYLLDAPWRWPLLWALTFASLLALYIWLGFIVADFAALSALLPDDVEGWLAELPPALAVVGAAAGMTIAARGLYAESPLRGSVVGLGGIALVFATSGGALEWLSTLELFAHGEEVPVAAVLVTGALLTSLVLVPAWRPLRVLGCALALVVAIATLVGLWRLARDSDLLRAAGVVLMAVAVLAAVATPLRRVRALGLPGTIVNLLSAFVIRLLGAILLVAVAVEWYPDLRAAVLEDPALDEARLGLALAATLLAPVVFGGLPGRASLHREYRQRLESCFGVARREDGGAERVRSAPLSPAPPDEPAHRFPRLLVCATANVRGRGSDGRRWRFQPFVLSHDRCGVPGDAEAGFSTSQLELGEAPAGLLTRRKERLLSLFTAVAATGAAVSPSMGRYTVPSLRPIIAALNFRLGRWIPNPYSARARAAVAARTTPGAFDRRRRLGSGYDELVPEMLGLRLSRSS